MSDRSQCDLILTHLQEGNPITPLEALKRFGVMRLAARVADLRQRGHDIVTLAHQTPQGKRVAKYWLLRSA